MKIFFRSLIGLIVVAILAIIIIAFIGWSSVPDMLANNLSKKMKVPVEIGDISLSMNSIKVKKFEIGNPRPAILPKAFSSELITVDAPLTRYLDKKIVIEDILIDNVYLGLEFNTITGTEGNWTTIMQNYQQASTPAAPEKEENKKSVLIRKLIFTNINVDLVFRKGDQKVQHLKPIPRLEFTDVTSEGGIPTDQIMNSVLGRVLKSVFEKENVKNMLDNLLNQPGNPIQKYVEPFRGLFGSSEEDANLEKESAVN